MEAVGEAAEAARDLKDLSVSDPHWILDRRNSGRLFWRRETASGDCAGSGSGATESGSRNKNRVKFRCEVEVLEFLKSEAEAERMEWEEEEDDQWRRRGWDHEIPPPSSFWGGVCALAIAAVLTYQWMAV